MRIADHITESKVTEMTKDNIPPHKALLPVTYLVYPGVFPKVSKTS